MGRVIRKSDLNKYVQNALRVVRENQRLCKLLYYTDFDPIAQPDILNTKILSQSDTKELKEKKCVFLNNFVPEITENKKNILGIYYITEDAPEIQGFAMKNVYMGFTVLCHIDLWECEEGVRPLSILEELDNIFDCQDEFEAIGEAKSQKPMLYEPNKYFKGYKTVIKIQDYN